MTDDSERAEVFTQSVIARVRALRKASGKTQDDVAKALGIPLERYKKYESRSPLPLYLVGPFSQKVNASVEFIVTGLDSIYRRGRR